MAKRKKKSQKSSKLFRRIAVSVGIALLAIVVLLWPYIISGAPKATTLYIRPGGTTYAALQDSITNRLGADYATKVVRLLKLSQADLQHRHGAFRVRKGETPLTLARHLRGGAPSSITVTLNNIRTKEELADLLSAKLMMTRSEILSLLNDAEVCRRYEKTPENIVTLFLPDSYDFYWDITPKQLLEKMDIYHSEFWNSERLAKAKRLGLTPDQVAIIASITEEESSKVDERGKIGRLYINRFRAGQRLQADPTVKFALRDFSIKRITVPMTQNASPYNTYRVVGLPPGPIRLPEKATIDAILNSAPHNYMYMCAKPDFSGYHNFATTYEQHLVYAEQYRAALDRNGIK